MHGAVRSIARRVLPPQLKHQVADVVGRAMLSRVPVQNLDAGRLRRSGTIDLGAIFHDEAVSEAWERDVAAVFSTWPSGTGSGSVNRGDCRAIYYLVAALKPKTVVEIGTNVAGSSMFIAVALRSHCGADARLTTVDIVDVNAPSGPWSQTNELTQPPIAYVRDFELGDQVEFVTEPALDYLARLTDVDLIFLDGSHAHDDVYRELARASRALRPGGAILLHDYYPGGKALFESTRPLLGPYRAVQRYLSEGAAIEVIPFGQLPWPTRRHEGSSFSSLAMVLGRQ